MKRFCGFLILVTLLAVVIPGSLRAQSSASIETFDRQVCSGASLFLNGGLYRILTNDCEILSIKANGTGEDLKGKEWITLTASATYQIQYKDNANPGGAVANARIDVIAQPTLSIAVTSPNPVPAAVCKGTRVNLRATGNMDVYWLISTDRDFSQQGTTMTFELEESCRVTAQSHNACGFVEKYVDFNVISEPDLSKAELIVDTNMNGAYCMDCGFFPKTADIVKGATMGTVKESTVTWADGTTEEKTIGRNSFSEKIKVHAVVEMQAGSCGASATATRTIDREYILNVKGGSDCKPEVKPSVTLTPCKDGEVTLDNLSSACTLTNPTLISSNPKITINPVSGRFPYDEGNGKNVYYWKLNWENYTPQDPVAVLTAGASYSINCPYSASKPTLTGNISKPISVNIDTSYLTFRYEYCPDGTATLEISGDNTVTINEVTLIRPTGGLSGSFRETASLKNKKTYESVEAITTSLLPKYRELRLKVKYRVEYGTCQFDVEREEVKTITTKDCNMDLLLEQTGSCIGEPRTVRMTNADGMVADYIEVAPHEKFTFKQYPGEFMFEPYYAGAPGIPSVTDDITVTMYYHMEAAPQQILSMTKEFKGPDQLKVEACKPYFNGSISINSGEKSKCPMCPGASLNATIEFKNTTTSKDNSNVTLITTNASRNGKSPDDAWVKSNTKLQYRLTYYLYDDLDYEFAVTYNEGDSIYTIPKMDLVDANGNPISASKASGEVNFGETASTTSVTMANICNLMAYAGMDNNRENPVDSVCSGELLDLYVYSKNLFDTLYNITWDNAEVQKVGTGEETFNYVYGTGKTQNRNIKLYHYRVNASAPGIYPFVLRSKIRDSVIERRDTIKVAVLENPRIFIQDTVYACLNDRVNLWEYVDSAAIDVKTLISNSPDGLIVGSATDDYREATANLRYTCGKKTLTERISIKTAPSVYNAFIDDAEYCPGEQV
ncbi:MAG: hypothetical protein NC324_09325, partial [Bacteroides sp.]|nr:hypothetical protein [Bacteroides sp.]